MSVSKKDYETIRYYDPYNDRQNKSTGAKRAASILTAVGILLGSTAVGLFAGCNATNPTEAVCPVTLLTSKVLGYETALAHHHNDLQKYKKDHSEIDGIVIYPERYHYEAPIGFTLENGVAVQYVNATRTERQLPNGKWEVEYTVPSGYILTTDNMGNKVGLIRVTPNTVIEPAGVTYRKATPEGNEIYGYWSYDGDNFTHEEASDEMTLSYKR